MIGVFDSGIGGLSVLKALRAELPGERFVYVADSGHAPYGERDAAHVTGRARALTHHLVGLGAQALVVACNTATAAAIHLLRQEHPDLPIIGVEPALKPAVALSRSGRIGVMATRGTLASPKFEQLLASLQGQARFVLQPCDGLAWAIENSVDGTTESSKALQQACREQVQALMHSDSQPPDTVVLGCTHYPFAADVLQQLLGPQVQLVDTGEAVARQTRARLQGLAQRPASAPGLVLLSTGDPLILQQAARRWIAPHASAQQVQVT